MLVISRGSEAGVLFQRALRFDTSPSNVAADPRGTPPPSSDAASLTVKIGDRTINYPADHAPFQEGATLMVPIQVTAKLLGLSYDESDASIFAESESHSLRFEQSSTSYRIDGRSDNVARSRCSTKWFVVRTCKCLWCGWRAISLNSLELAQNMR